MMELCKKVTDSLHKFGILLIKDPRAVEQDNRLALDILTFYHQGMAQLAELNGRTTDDDAERLAEKMQVKVKRDELGLPKEVATFDPHDLSAFKK